MHCEPNVTLPIRRLKGHHGVLHITCKNNMVLSWQVLKSHIRSLLGMVINIHTFSVVLVWQVLEFKIRKEMTLEMWTDRQDKIQTFFGPGVQADIQKTEQVVQICTCQSCRAIACPTPHGFGCYFPRQCFVVAFLWSLCGAYVPIATLSFLPYIMGVHQLCVSGNS